MYRHTSEKAYIICPQFWGRKWLRQFLWAPGKFAFFLRIFLQENLRAHKIPRFRGVYLVFCLRGGGSADFIFKNGHGDFSERSVCCRTTPLMRAPNQ